jgi:hypothetical protein
VIEDLSFVTAATSDDPLPTILPSWLPLYHLAERIFNVEAAQ